MPLAPANAYAMGMLASATMVVMPAPAVTLSRYELAALLCMMRKRPTRDAQPRGSRGPTPMTAPLWQVIQFPVWC